jgi:hypothetical protein
MSGRATGAWRAIHGTQISAAATAGTAHTTRPHCHPRPIASSAGTVRAAAIAPLVLMAIV